MNIQFALKMRTVLLLKQILEPLERFLLFKACELSKSATKAMVGKTLKEIGFSNKLPDGYFFVKEAVLPFDKFPSVDPILGPEMKSTGEVMGIGSLWRGICKSPKSSQ